jgi:hypothetical protein
MRVTPANQQYWWWRTWWSPSSSWSRWLAGGLVASELVVVAVVELWSLWSL